MLPTVALIYLCYNERKYLPDVFESIRSLNYPEEKLEVIVVDNASSDGSTQWLHENREGITLLTSDKNLGYAGGNNLGLEHALLGGADYVYLLNGDAKLHQDALMEAVTLAESDQTIGAVQSRVMMWQQPEIVNVTGGAVQFLGYGYALNNGREWKDVCKEVEDGQELAYASGASVLYRSSALKTTGLIEPFYFMYHDDLELGWRLWLAGYRSVLSTRSVTYHDYEFKRSIQKFYWMERNRILVHLSHLRWRTLLLLAPFMCVAEIGSLVFAAKGGWLKEKLMVYVNLVSPTTWRHIRKKRKESRLIRTVEDAQIVKRWTGIIAHQETSNWIVDRIANPMMSLTWHILRRIIV